MRSWKDAPFELSIEIEKIDKKDLIPYMGVNPNLDKRIGELLKNHTPHCWKVLCNSQCTAPFFIGGCLYKPCLVGIDCATLIDSHIKNAYNVLIEMQGTSTGYYDSHTCEDCYSPMDEDEREIHLMKLIPLLDDSLTKNVITLDDGPSKFLFEEEFSKWIYQAEIDKE